MDQTKIITGLATTTLSDTSILNDLKDKVNKTYFKFKFNDESTHKLLYKYLENLYYKCSKIVTIIDLNKTVPLINLYESIILERISSDIINKKTRPIEFMDIDNVLNNYLEQNIIITDTAGMGKTTFSKIFVLELLKRDELKKFPLFIELRKVKLNQNLYDYILEEINTPLKEKITLKELEFLIMKNIFIFVLDGFDEIDENNKIHLSAEINKLSNLQANNILLTTRKQENLPRIYQQSIYQFKFLSKDNIHNILNKLDRVYSLDIGKQLIKHKNFIKLDLSLFQTPLMVNLLYVYFFYTKDIDDNIVNFYDQLFNALYKGHDLTKESFKRKHKSNLDLLSFRKLFNAFSFVSIYFNTIYYNSESSLLEKLEMARKISGIKVDNLDNYLNDLLCSIPLLLKEGNEFKFVHKTIAEYFAAEFLNTTANNIELFRKIKNNNKQLVFKKTFEFLYELNYNLFLKEIAKDFLIDYLEFYNKNSVKDDLFIMITHMFNVLPIILEIKTFETKTFDKLHDEILKYNLEYSSSTVISLIRDKIIFYSQLKDLYDYLPIKFFNTLLSPYKNNNIHKEYKLFKTKKKEDSLNTFFERNLLNQEMMFDENILKLLFSICDFTKNENLIIDIEKVKYLINKETELDNSLNLFD